MDEALKDAIDKLHDAVYDQGSHPSHHAHVMARHRAEWPSLWAAIDALLKAVEGNEGK